MNQLLVTPTENYQWTQALRQSPQAAGPEPVFTFPLRPHKGYQSEFTNWLTEQILTGRKRITKQSLQAAKCLAVNIYRAAQEHSTTGFLYSLGKKAKAVPKRFRREPFSRDTMTAQLNKAQESGLITIEKGFKSDTYISGLPSLIMPTEYCKKQLSELEGGSVIDISQASDPLILRRDTNDYILYDDDAQTLRLRSAIRAHNEVRLGANWSYEGMNGERFTLHPSDLTCRRIFKEDWQTGGRFYCDAQNLSKVTRNTITVDGEPCIELDYKSMHPRMLYHLSGLEAPIDCYDIEGIKRDTVKKIALIATSTSSKKQAIRAVCHHLKVRANEAGRLLHSFEIKHKPIAGMLYQEAWKWLQYTDSLVAQSVLGSLSLQGVPALPIHDSFIVPTRFGSMLSDTMHEAYHNQLGFSPAITAS